MPLNPKAIAALAFLVLLGLIAFESIGQFPGLYELIACDFFDLRTRC